MFRIACSSLLEPIWLCYEPLSPGSLIPLQPGKLRRSSFGLQRWLHPYSPIVCSVMLMAGPCWVGPRYQQPRCFLLAELKP